jgi:FkbM family methyltransferase
LRSVPALVESLGSSGTGAASRVLRHRNGAKFLVGGDPLDRKILAEMHGRYAALYFPEGLDRIPPEAWILDVGAHRGFFATAIIQHCPGARVIAVEPDPIAMAALQANIALNGFEGRTETVEAGLGECDGYGYLLRSNQGSWSNHLTADPCHGNVVRVRIVRLSSILRDRRPYVVKCNAEGGEFHLLPQLFQLAAHPAIIILMAHPEAGPVNELLALLLREGYHLTPIQSSPIHPRYVCRLS